MTDLDLTKLREVAVAAHDTFERQDFVGMIDTGSTYRRALDASTVLALIDEVERLRGVVEQVRDLAESYPPIASTRPVGTESIRIYERYVVARKFRAILGDHLGGGMK